MIIHMHIMMIGVGQGGGGVGVGEARERAAGRCGPKESIACARAVGGVGLFGK